MELNTEQSNNLTITTITADAELSPKLWLPWDNPENVISRDIQQLCSKIFLSGVLPMMLLAGYPGNILSAAVYIRQGLRCKVNLLLFSLAVADLLYLMLNTLTFISVIARLTGASMIFPSWNNPELLVADNTVFLISSLLLSLISLDRCVAVLLPFKMTWLTWRQTLAFIFLFICFSTVSHLPWYLTYKTGNINNSTAVYHQVTQLGQAVLRALPSEVIFFASRVVKPACFVFVLFCTIITSGKLMQVSRFRTQASSSLSNGQVKIVKTILFVSFFFFLSVIPDLVLSLFDNNSSQFKFGGSQHNAFLLTYHVCSLAKSITASVNFYIYFLMGSRFRDTLRQLLECRSCSCFVCLDAKTSVSNQTSNYSMQNSAT